MSQESNEGKQYRVEDMSGTGIPAGQHTTRGRVASENPAVQSPLDAERYHASEKRAREALAEAEERVRAEYEQSARPTQQQPHIPQEHSAQQPTEQNLSSQSRPRSQSDLRQLAFTGRIEEDHEVNGFVFTMRTLTGKENNEAAKALGMGNDLENMGSLRHAILARSIQFVNGAPLEVLYQGSDKNKLTTAEQKELVIGEWQQTLITELMLRYDDMLNRSTETFGTKEDLKK